MLHVHDSVRIADPDDAQVAGRGSIVMEHTGTRTRIVRRRAASPLKLLCPDIPGKAAWIYVSTFGGGLVAGDCIDLNLELGPDSVGVLTTQASTKVFHRQDHRGASQCLTARIGSEAMLVVWPDPLVCFRDAVYEQHQQFHVEPGGNVVLLDWLTAGRVAYGERWCFARYRSCNELIVGGQAVARDVLLLDPIDGPLDSPHRMANYDCLANVYLFGPKLESVCEALAADVGQLPVDPAATMLESVSRWNWGVVWRIMGRSTAQVAETLRNRVSFLSQMLGQQPWARKW